MLSHTVFNKPPHRTAQSHYNHYNGSSGMSMLWIPVDIVAVVARAQSFKFKAYAELLLAKAYNKTTQLYLRSVDEFMSLWAA